MDFEVKKVENGFVVHVISTGSEYVFSSTRQVIRFVKGLIEEK